MNSTDISLADLINLPLDNDVISIWRPTMHWDQMMMIIDALRAIEIRGRKNRTYDQVFNILNGYHKEALSNPHIIGQAIVAVVKQMGLQYQMKSESKKVVKVIKKLAAELFLQEEHVDLEDCKIKPAKKHK